jgi:hypothetical protein
MALEPLMGIDIMNEPSNREPMTRSNHANAQTGASEPA